MVIAAIGFAGSFSAVRDLAEKKGFGSFAPFFPIGVDAGIVVLLALDLLLTWIRIPFPLLRQTAWLLTAATIAFNGAAAWPDPLGVGMHAVIPVLFVVTVEAARHAVGRVADITADKHMEGVRLSRWLLAFPSTFRLWRRMKLWELRSYDEVIRMEQDRLVYETRLRARYGRAWRRRAPVEVDDAAPARPLRRPADGDGAADLVTRSRHPRRRHARTASVLAPGSAAPTTPPARRTRRGGTGPTGAWTRPSRQRRTCPSSTAALPVRTGPGGIPRPQEERGRPRSPPPRPSPSPGPSPPPRPRRAAAARASGRHPARA